MSRLEELLHELCPDGVEYKKISDVTTVARGKRVVRDQLSQTEGYPVYQNSLTVMGYHTETNFPANTTFVIGAGAAGEIGYAIKNFWAADDCFPIVGNENLLSRYIYHTVMWKKPYLVSKVRKASIPRLSRSFIEDLVIPVPPLEVQREIVRILDNFTELSVKLLVELNKRKEQYEYYRSVLFEKAKNTWHTCMLSDCCSIEKGKTPIQKAVPGKYPLVVTTSERKSNDSYQFDTSAVCIPLVSSRGHGVASLNHVYYQEGKFALGNILCAVVPMDCTVVSAKYLYYYFEQTKDYTLVPLMKGGANVALHISDIEKVKVPIPPMTDQEQIIKKLEIFEKMVIDCIPAEIEARQKQYEYYRDKLLSFSEMQND